ncbi:hypothetical protein AB0M43_34200 [Longispora sp. NPDC051575]|uniref:hypothetical protein n=1 Tax=Longispora sp. NPDC051575 TaxID=3154943 RepID=UPI00342ED198
MNPAHLRAEPHPYTLAHAFGELLMHRPAWWLLRRCRRCRTHWPCPDYTTAKNTLTRAGLPGIPERH